MRHSLALACVTCILSVTGVAVGQIDQSQTLTSGIDLWNRDFGGPIAIDGRRAIVGFQAFNDLSDSGGVVFFERDDAGTWSFDGVFDPPGGFLSSAASEVAIDGLQAAVTGSVFLGLGPVRLYDRSGGAWTSIGQLAPPAGASADFGAAIAMANGRLAVGDTGARRVYVYEWNGTSWDLADTVSSFNFGLFGAAVAMNDDTLVVGDPGYDLGLLADVGRATVYRFQSDGSPVFADSLSPATNEDNGAFGEPIAISNRLVAVGSRGANVGDGRVGVFERGDSDDWNRIAWLPAVDGEVGAYPRSLAVNGDRILAGAPDSDFYGIGVGSVYVYQRSAAGTVNFVDDLQQTTPQPDTGFGVHVAFDGPQAMTSNQDWTITIGGTITAVTGATHVFDVFDVDCDGDGIPDDEAIASGLVPDWNGDGIPDACDPLVIAVPGNFSDLQAALDNVPPGGVVALGAGDYDAGPYVVNTPCTIAGTPGFDVDLRAPGGGSYALIVNAEVTLENISFSGDGAAIDLNAGNGATIRHCGFFNLGSGRVEGGAIEADQGTRLEIIGSSFEGCSAGLGGAIDAIDCDIEIIDTNFVECFATGFGLPTFVDVVGGAIRTQRGSLVIEDSSFTDCLALSDVIDCFEPNEAYGGAIFAQGPSVIDSMSIRIERTTFDGNAARSVVSDCQDFDFAGSYGGAIALRYVSLDLFESTFTGNEARATFIAIPGQSLVAVSAEGGAVWGEYIDVSLANVTVSGGGAFAITERADGTVIEQNRTGGMYFGWCRSVSAGVAFFDGITGTGLFVDPDSFEPLVSVTLENVFFTNSTSAARVVADSIALANCVVRDMSRGGLTLLRNGAPGGTQGLLFDCDVERVYGAPALTVSNAFTIENSRIQRNNAFPNKVIRSFDTVTVLSSEICGNVGGAIEGDFVNLFSVVTDGGCGGVSTIQVPSEAATIAEALAQADFGTQIVVAPGTYAISEPLDVRFAQDVSIIGSGSTQTILQGDGSGPVIVASCTSGIEVSALRILGGSPGVLVDASDMLLDGVSMFLNSGEFGGAARVEGGGTLELFNCEIESNDASAGGGAVAVLEGGLVATETGFVGNDASPNGDGGAIWVGAEGSFTIARSSFETNQARDGGAIFAQSGGDALDRSIDESDFDSNSASGSGGALFVPSATISDSMFETNTAAGRGGAIRATAWTTIIGCDIGGGQASIGGGIAASAAEVVVDATSRVCGNSATVTGDDVFGVVLDDLGERYIACSGDCDGDGISDADAIAAGATDCNGDGIPDDCQMLVDADLNGVPDECEGGSAVKRRTIFQTTVAPFASIDLLARPLLSDSDAAWDVLALNPEGSLRRVVPAGAGFDYLFVPNATFDGSCPNFGSPITLNNGPFGARTISWAGGDLVFGRDDGDAGLYTEDFQLYIGCNAPIGAGLPQDATDYDLGTGASGFVSLRYDRGFELAGGVASGPSGKSEETAQAVVGAGPDSSTTTARTSPSRRGSGQGGSGPYPGEDAEWTNGLSQGEPAAGDLSLDGNDDIVIPHPIEGQITVLRFGGLTDTFGDFGELIPGGPDWLPEQTVSTLSGPIRAAIGQFDDDAAAEVAVLCAGGDAVQVFQANGVGLLAGAITVPIPAGAVDMASGHLDADEDLELVVVGEDGGGAWIAVIWSDGDELRSDVQSLGSAPRSVSMTSRRYGGPRGGDVVAVLRDGPANTVIQIETIGIPRDPAPLANDECQGALVVGDGSFAANTATATTTDLPLPGACLSGGSVTIHDDVWFAWTATTSGLAEVSTCDGAGFDTRLAAYSGSCGALAIEACNDDGPGCANFTSRLVFDARCGETYYVRVGSFRPGQGGPVTVTFAGGGGSCGDPADLNGDGVVNGADLALVLAGWGGSGPADINGDGVVDGADLALVLAAWTG